MKKILCTILTLSMILALAACGGSTPAPAQTAAPALEETAEPAPKEAAAPAPEETAAPEAAEPELAAEDLIGEKSGSSYVNQALGVRAELPEDWQQLNNEEIAEAMGYAKDQVTDEKVAAMLEESGSVCDFYAVKTDGSGCNINIQVQKLNVIQGAALTEEDILSSSVDAVKQGLESIGFENVEISQEMMRFAGAEHASLSSTATYSGVPVYERQVLVKAGRYIGIVTVFAFDRESVDAYLAFFTAA